jgi:ubiquinone/menaquinone biosynthesis C-methylase UbiE
MVKEYDLITAFHYAAFRPALHVEILKEAYKTPVKQNLGLDVGCGTGHSSIALANFCEKVIGIDPSLEMLNKSLKHPRVEYSLYNLKNFDFANDCFDTITFAGSLYYAKSQQLLDEVVRVIKPNATILVYDFELSLDNLLNKLDLHSFSKQKPEYNHQENFSGLNQKAIKINKELKKSISLEIASANLVHLLLSSKDNYDIFLESFGYDNLYNKVLQKLKAVLKAENTTMEAMTYLTIYRILK